jgi:DNA-binding CsgD family transcriptional regulator
VRAHLQIRMLQEALEEKNALLQKAIALRLEAENQLQQSLDRAVVVVCGGNEIQFCTRLARQLLEAYFPAYQVNGTLPAPILDWVKQRQAGAPWQIETEETRLEVRLFAEPQPGDAFMLMLEEHLTNAGSASTLLRLGLTAREAQVLYWIAHGKTNPEVAIILDAALNTVKKHVQNILLKLGVETRLAAALRATEILGLSNADAVHADSD